MKALKISSDNTGLLNNKGIALIDSKKSDEALIVFDQVI